MKQENYFIKTIKETPAEEPSTNAQLLIRAGFIDKLMAGVYSYLPLGLRVLTKIKQIVREEMNAIGAQEILMPALQPKELWQATGRWESMKDILFRFKGRGGNEFCLAPTHEESVVDIASQRIQSYKDMPFGLFQIQDKFRNEPRAKSGLLRGREFSMKDLYSFHTTEDDLNKYYKVVAKAYHRIFERLGLDILVVEAPGGAISKDVSHEFQVLTPSGEDTIFHCSCGWAQNKEIAKVKKGHQCPACGQGEIMMSKGIEVGNIFKLGKKYSEDMNLVFTNQDGQREHVYMGCYGLGPSRVMGALVEIYNDKDGIKWPKSVAPFQAHLLLLSDSEQIKQQAEKLYKELIINKIDVLYDNRVESTGVKLKEADLIGIPIRLVISDKTNDLIEYKERSQADSNKLEIKDVVKRIKDFYHV